MNKKNMPLSLDTVKERFQNKGLILLTKNYINNQQLLDCEDKYGYRYNTTIMSLNNLNMTKLTYTLNKWSLYNINKYIENNKIPVQLLSKEYINSVTPMEFRCQCGHIYYSSWSDFKGRHRYYCRDCMQKFKRKRLNQEFVFKEYKEAGLTIMPGQEYKNNRTALKCKTKNGYIVYKTYDGLTKSFENQFFSYKHNKENYVYNVNNYLRLHNIKGECLKVLDSTIGIHGQHYIVMKCECGNIFNSCIDYIKNGRYRCPQCNKVMSHGELKIKNILINLGIGFKTQYKFVDCVYMRNLLFDFYLPDYNCCIEYDGEQHYQRLGFQTQIEFENGCKRDEIKNQYCQNNNIKLIRIPYFELDNAENIITNSIKV